MTRSILGGLVLGSLLFASLLVACGPGTRDDDGGVRDAAAPDGGVADAGPDAGMDAGPDAGTDAGPADGGPGPRALTSVRPDRGPLAGGTAVELRGTGFEASTTFTFGAAACTGLVIADPTLASCLTPAGVAGAVDVHAHFADGATAQLAAAFTYEAANAQVDFLKLTRPSASTTVAAGAPVSIEALVFEMSRTQGKGQGPGIVLEAGFGPATADPAADPGAFAWAALTYFGDQDGLTVGDLSDDLYGGRQSVPARAGVYRLALRASLDGGAYLYGDLGGSDDGFSAADLPLITLGTPTSVVVDGAINAAEWGGASETNATTATDWTGDTLDRLLVKIEGPTLYLGVVGALEGGNAWVVYLDAQRGGAGGVSDPTGISDGTGALDNALSSGITTPANVKVDFAWGTIDLSRAASGFDDRMGWRDLATNPADLGWIDSALAPTVCGAAACETSISLSTLGSVTGTPIALFARLVSGTGQQASNQCLPPDAPLVPMQVSTLLELTP